MTGQELHVVFGAGQIGPPLARLLRDRGHSVRIVRRSGNSSLDGIPVIQGDAGNAGFAADVTRDATALYHCMNPPYSATAWAEQLPRIATSMIAAAERNHARLVVLDNLYSFGPMKGQAMNEDTPVAPSSRKGEIRAAVAEQFFAAHRAGTARVVLGRAPDFYGPGGEQTNFSEFFWKRVLAGQSGQVIVPPDVPHAFSYTHDVAAGLATLGAAPDDALGHWWMLPAAPALTVREMANAFGRVLGREVRVDQMPAFLFALAQLFIPVLREMPEMRYQWSEPYLVDDSRFRARFGAAPTPLEQGASATVAWAKEKFGR